MRDTLDGVIKLLKYTTLSFQSPISTNVAGRGNVHNCVPPSPVSSLSTPALPPAGLLRTV